MSEPTLDLRGVPRPEAYATLEQQGKSVLEGIVDEVAAMATWSALIHQAFSHLWTGFYRVAQPGKLLRIGPYQGSLGCLEIPFGRGVCGTTAARGQSTIVADVSEFQGHISCDARSQSEIVVPVFGKAGDLLAVLDVDSAQLAAFDEVDRVGLERLMTWFRS